MADQKLSQKAELTTITDDDLLWVVDAPGGTPGDKKVTFAHLREAILNDPTLTGAVTIPTPFYLGAVGVVSTGAELNYVAGATSAIQTQLNTKAPIASPTFTGTVGGITATMVGLGNVNNTSDANKPVSTAQQTALNLKANLVSPSFTTPALGTPSSGTLTNCTFPTLNQNTTGSAATVTGAAQTAITSVGTLTSLEVAGAIRMGIGGYIIGDPVVGIRLNNYADTLNLIVATNDGSKVYFPQGNVGILTTTPGGSGTVGAGVFSLGNGTAPIGGVANQVSLYSADVSASAQLFAMDEAGTVTQLTGGLGPNSFQIDQSGGTNDTYGVLAGSINSSNKTFTASLASYISGSLRVYLNGQLQTQGTGQDWVETTPTSGTFTFDVAPTSGDEISAVYQHASAITGNADTLDGSHASAFATPATIAAHAALITGVHGLVFTAGKTLTLTESLTLNALPIGSVVVATAANTLGSLAVGATTEILVGGGAGVVPIWTAATGTGAPVRATSPTLVTPILGVAAATSLSVGSVSETTARQEVYTHFQLTGSSGTLLPWVAGNNRSYNLNGINDTFCAIVRAREGETITTIEVYLVATSGTGKVTMSLDQYDKNGTSLNRIDTATSLDYTTTQTLLLSCNHKILPDKVYYIVLTTILMAAAFYIYPVVVGVKH